MSRFYPDGSRNVDLFCGVGWEVALDQLGHSALGIDIEPDVYDTRVEAGFDTVQRDVSELHPLQFGPIHGLIGSPPCQAWSPGGKRAGRRDRTIVEKCARDLAVGRDSRFELLFECEDKRSLLVVEPLRWALEASPTWIALEQVPAVIEVWRLFAEILRASGYSTWVGVLSAEQFGVPQTRQRAFMLAHRDRSVAAPEPTHQTFEKGHPPSADLHGARGPWISLGEALGLPSDVALGFPRRADTTTNPSADVVEIDGVDYRGRDFRRGDEPSFALTSKARSWKLFGHHRDGGVPGTRACRRLDQPSLTIDTRGDLFRFAQTVPGPGEGIPLELEQAAALQTFPKDFPWEGSRTSRFAQVGNAVPPLLARSVLASVVEPAAALEAAA